MNEVEKGMFENFVLKCIMSNVFTKTYEFEIVKIKDKNSYRDVIVVYLTKGFGVCSFNPKLTITNFNNLNRKDITFVSRFDEVVINNLLFRFKLKDWYGKSLKEIEKIYLNESDYKLFNVLLLGDNVKNEFVTKETLNEIINKVKISNEYIHISLIDVYKKFIYGKIKVLDV